MSQGYVTLPTGTRMPSLGLGTWAGKADLSPVDENEMREAIESALDAGYKLIDTAPNYLNQHIIGDVISDRIKNGSLKREDIFITTKLGLIFMDTQEHIERCMELCLEQLKLDYVDLFLIHTPWAMKYKDENTLFPVKEDGALDFVHADLAQTWRGMEKLVDKGKVRAIGVSNFSMEQIDRIHKVARHPISNHQIEIHAYLQQPKMVQFCQKKNITVTAYSPLGTPGHITLGGSPFTSNDAETPLDNDLIKSIAAKYNKTSAQILLRNLVQRQLSVVPKSKTPSRIRENIQALDFNLADEDMKAIAKLDKELRIFHMGGFKDHPEFYFNKS